MIVRVRPDTAIVRVVLPDASACPHPVPPGSVPSDADGEAVVVDEAEVVAVGLVAEACELAPPHAVSRIPTAATTQMARDCIIESPVV
jgi:hypothetical protein